MVFLEPMQFLSPAFVFIRYEYEAMVCHDLISVEIGTPQPRFNGFHLCFFFLSKLLKDLVSRFHKKDFAGCTHDILSCSVNNFHASNNERCTLNRHPPGA